APDFWLISESWDAEPIGYITSPWYSPELNQNIAMGYVPVESTALGTERWVHLPDVHADVPRQPVAAGIEEIPVREVPEHNNAHVPDNPVAAETVQTPLRQSANPNQRERLRAKGRDAAD